MKQAVLLVEVSTIVRGAGTILEWEEAETLKSLVWEGGWSFIMADPCTEGDS